jgi:tripartite-type tricarboxylate transporter receptor subunit TctC
MTIAKCFFAAACAAFPLFAMAQTYPAKPIRIVVPFPPGGADVTARQVAPRMQEEMGQAIIIENRAGANGLIGTEFVAKQAPDGYTLLWTANNPIVTGPVTTPKETHYDPNRDLTHISLILTGVVTLAISSALPVNSLRELIDYAKKNPGKISYASVGVGSSQHIDGEIIKKRTGIDMLHVPFKGFGQIMPDLVAGRVQLASLAYTTALPQVAAGKVKIIGVTLKPYAKLPAVPVIEEVIGGGYERMPAWSASLHGPANIPRPVVNRIYASLAKTLAVNTELRTGFENDGFIVNLTPPEQFTMEVREALQRTARLLKESGVKVEE